MAGTSFGKRGPGSGVAYAPAPLAATAGAPASAAPDVWRGAAPLTSQYLGPTCTIGILAVLILVFLVQEAQALGGGSAGYGFNHRSLMALGADSLSLIRQGQWWRVFTAPMLHANPGHLIGNGIVLALVGLRFERLIGWGWFLAVYFVSAIIGEFASLASIDPAAMGVGASGAIMGLLSAMLVCSFHVGAKGQQIKMRWLALRVMIPAMLPLGGNGAHAGMVINYSAHAGGAMAGVAMGLVINAVWPQDEPKPLGRLLAEWVGVVGMVATIGAFAMGALRYPEYQAINATLAPDAEIPREEPQAVAASGTLEARYPKDPRVRLFVAMGDQQVGLYSAASSELATALGDTDQLSELPPQTAALLHAALAFSLLQQGDRDGARAAAAPVCGYHFPSPKTGAALNRFGLCRPASGGG